MKRVTNLLFVKTIVVGFDASTKLAQTQKNHVDRQEFFQVVFFVVRLPHFCSAGVEKF